MNANHSNNYSYLDKVRMNNGIDKCKTVFQEAHKKNRKRAIALLNDQRITFPCLFILLPQIEALNLYSHLNSRNITVIKIINQILKPQDSNNGIDYLSTKKDSVYSALKWMLETGSTEDSLNHEYEGILDVTVSVLINIYEDKSILPVVADMIFERSKKGHYIHDLVWAFFQIRDPNALRLIAEQIRSSDQENIQLACNLLNIEASNTNDVSENQKQYESFLQWLTENDPFLYFTGETFQFASKPTFCTLDLERKYMNKGISSYNKQPITPSDDHENKCLEAFKALSNEEKAVLSGYSYKIHNQDISEWKRWMQVPIGEQIRTAKTELERSQ